MNFAVIGECSWTRKCYGGRALSWYKDSSVPSKRGAYVRSGSVISAVGILPDHLCTCLDYYSRSIGRGIELGVLDYDNARV